MKHFIVLLSVFTAWGFCPADVITVDNDGPADYDTIQGAIDFAQTGDTVLIAEGIYHENLQVSNKSITLASDYLNSGQADDILQTVIDGGGATVLTLSNVTEAMMIVGLTIRNGNDGISPDTKFTIQNCYIHGCNDGIDYEGGGGICKNNIFQNNADDGIDLDGAVDVIIEHNIIRDNDDDGIEIRFYAYSGPLVTCVIRNNTIIGNGEDGIQLIDYPDDSSREFIIANNVIAHTSMAAIGCMSNGNTVENYEAADIPEAVTVSNNTFYDNEYGITGGDNMTVVNNLFVGTRQTALKKVDGGSSVTYNNYWQNTLDLDGTASSPTNRFENPLFADAGNDDFHLKSEYGRWSPIAGAWVFDPVTSPCIDMGDPASDWSAELWPHGKRINMGVYGGTPESSMSASNVGNIANLNNDINDEITLEDFALFTEKWLTEENFLMADFNLDGIVNLEDFAVFARGWLE